MHDMMHTHEEWPLRKKNGREPAIPPTSHRWNERSGKGKYIKEKQIIHNRKECVLEDFRTYVEDDLYLCKIAEKNQIIWKL